MCNQLLHVTFRKHCSKDEKRVKYTDFELRKKEHTDARYRHMSSS